MLAETERRASDIAGVCRRGGLTPQVETLTRLTKTNERS